MAAPPLPPGFTLDAPSAGKAPPLPEGFTLDTKTAVDPSGTYRNEGGRLVIRGKYPSLDRYAESPGATELLADTGRSVLGGLVHGVGTLADVVTGTGPGEGSYAERWSQPFAGRSSLLNAPDPQLNARLQSISRGLDTVIGTGPLAQTVRERVPQAFEAITTAVPLLKGAGVGAQAARTPLRTPLSAEQVLSNTANNSQQSMGAAAAAPRLQNVSPELRQSIVNTAQRTGGAVNPEVLNRHIDAESLPVRVPLTEGQATANVQLLSNEQNMRARIPAFAERFNQQNRALGQNMQAIRDQAGPDVFSANHVEHGDTLINAYRAVDAERESAISAAYSQLRANAGGQFPVGAKTLLGNASRELHSQLLFDHAPGSVMKTLERLAATPGAMTFENFESLRTNLATIMRTATDGNERRAAGVIRQAMEELPLVPGAERLKPLADRARALARARFAAIDADPAYSAAINETVPPDRFIQKFVIGGTRDDLARMRATIGADDSATQTMGVAALDYLRDQARLSPTYEGNFASASFNKALQRLAPNLRSLLRQDNIEQLEALGRVSGYTTAQPRGSFVNNSNTFTAAAAEGAKGAVEGMANVAAAGVPVGTWVRRGMEGRSARRQANRSMAPGAGLDRLPEQP